MSRQLSLFDTSALAGAVANAITRVPEDIRVLIGCEMSGTVRKAFEALGFDAWSCDLKPDVERSNRHMQCDIREVLDDDWDFLAVMHPSCLRLTNSGVRWLKVPPKNLNPENYSAEDCKRYKRFTDDQKLAFMWQSLDEGAELFSDCWNADIPCKAVENPIMHKYAKERIRNYRDPAQIVQPWWFGDPAFKATGLYLENLPPLEPENKLTPPEKGTDEWKKWSVIHYASPGLNRSEIRSKTFPGLAKSMAKQWGAYLVNGMRAAA